MVILAADTGTSVNTVALWRDGRALVETVVDCGRAHSERLLTTVDWVLAEAGRTVSQVDVFAIAVGPGSFTGLRIGVAAWKGLALGTDRPLVGVPSLDAMSRVGGFQEAVVCPMVDAKMGEVFGAVYRFAGGVRSRVIGDRVCKARDLVGGLDQSPLVYGDGAELYRSEILEVAPRAVFLGPAFRGPRAAFVAEEAAELLEAGCPSSAAEVSPVYLRLSQPEALRAKAVP